MPRLIVRINISVTVTQIGGGRIVGVPKTELGTCPESPDRTSAIALLIATHAAFDLGA